MFEELIESIINGRNLHVPIPKNCNLSEETRTALFDALQSVKCKSIELQLDWNNIGDEGARALATSLQSPFCKLIGLYLSYNKVGCEGAKEFSIALQNPNCKLTWFFFDSNDIGDDGVNALTEAIQNLNCKLTTLTLDHRGRNERAESIIHRFTSENEQFKNAPPVLRSVLRIAGFHQYSTEKYMAILRKENIQTEEALASMDPLSLRKIGFPLGDAIRLLKALRMLHQYELVAGPYPMPRQEVPEEIRAMQLYWSIQLQVLQQS